MIYNDEIVSLVEKFLAIAEELLANGKIDKETFTEITKNKIIFLNQIKKI
ncbi:hypothetical protein Q428_07850 [Fervidicella metallireducens AeB]|uniref:Uncharacterized protein n=1 Tax=Fervidicella metallireducens AeB TaxID=1403537 RepID=A0A017RUQ0_9CLOT|nr:hypothetical protein [Fervidicella metallireducens]EYE88488.1 hypothetical protein Q428_07850 [Fervidicella metallireducens AeB]